MPNAKAAAPTIARVWRGRTRPEKADEYERYNFEAGIRPLIETAEGVQTFREDRDGETWFVTISWWKELGQMAAFAGGTSEAPHHLPRDPEFLIELPDRIEILNLRHARGTVPCQGVLDT